MKAIISVLSFGFMLFALTACFESAAPLFTPQNAAYPFGAQSNYVRYAAQSGPQSQGWTTSYSGVIALGDDRTYTETHLGDDKTSSVTRFILYALGEGYYIAADIGKAGSTDGAYYDLMKLEGRTAYLYSVDCADLGDDALTAANISPPDEDGFCEAQTLDGLVTVFKSMIAQGLQPTEKYVLDG